MRRAARGTTLLELMMVVAIITILATLSIGFSSSYRREQTLKDISRNIVNGLAQGRAEAVRRSTMMHVDFVNTANQVDIIAYTDKIFNWRYDTPGDGAWVFRWPLTQDQRNTGAVNQDTLTAPALVLANGHMTVLFDYQGNSVDINGNPLAALFCVADPKFKADVRAVQLSSSGAARVAGYTDGRTLCGLP